MISELEKKIEYEFKDKELLKTALTHSSYANEKKKDKLLFNERLEFLGDSVLGLIISEYLFKNFESYNEGEMSKKRATLVCETALSLLAKRIDLGKYLNLGKGEEKSGGRMRDSNLADSFEALIGAIYLDGGLDETKKFLNKNIIKILIENENKEILFIDYKTKLQEIIQKGKNKKIRYELIKEEGPDHNKQFTTNLYVDEELYGLGVGRSKKESEQKAAKKGFEKLCKETI